MGKFDKRQLLWGVIAGILTVAFMSVSYKVGLERGKDTAVSEESSRESEVENSEVFIAVRSDCNEKDLDSEQSNTKRYCLDYVEGETAFDALSRLDENNTEFSFDYDESDFGVFITSVNNYHPDGESEFWAFLVNGEMSMVGVSDHLVQDGEELGFRVEEVEF